MAFVKIPKSCRNNRKDAQKIADRKVSIAPSPMAAMVMSITDMLECTLMYFDIAALSKLAKVSNEFRQVAMSSPIVAHLYTKKYEMTEGLSVDVMKSALVHDQQVKVSEEILTKSPIERNAAIDKFINKNFANHKAEYKKKIKKYLLENKHFISVVMAPLSTHQSNYDDVPLKKRTYDWMPWQSRPTYALPWNAS
jgi:hypothetical protein